MNIEIVSWLDHYNIPGWTDAVSVPEDYIATTVGYPVLENKKYLVLAQSIAANGAVADLMHILKRSIIERKVLSDASNECPTQL